MVLFAGECNSALLTILLTFTRGLPRAEKSPCDEDALLTGTDWHAHSHSTFVMEQMCYGIA
jgi:hypothetical protein